MKIASELRWLLRRTRPHSSVQEEVFNSFNLVVFLAIDFLD